MSERLSKRVWLILLIAGALVFGWRINTQPLTNWDEGIYANVNLELFHSQDWTKLTYFGKDFLEKPPLQYWLTYPLFGIFGSTELAVRLLSVLSGVATVGLVGLWGWQATKKSSVALLAGAMIVLGRYAMAHAFRTGDLDGLLTLFITLAMYGYWRSWKTPRWFLVWGLAGAGAVMTKSLAGLIPVIVVGLDVLLTRGWRRIGWGNIGWGMIIFFGLAAPWHIIETIRFGSEFWKSYVGVSVLDRTTESFFTPTPWHWYISIIRDRFFPFSYALPLGVAMVIWRWRRDHDALARLLILWSMVVLGIFTYIQTRREWYILPMYPALALLLALQMETWWRERKHRVIQILIIISAVAMFARMAGDAQLKRFFTHVPGGAALHHWPFTDAVGQKLLGIVVVAIFIAIAMAWRRRYSWRRTFLALTGGVMAMVAIFWTIQSIRSYPRTLPLKTIADRIRQEQLLNIDLIGTKLKKEPAGYFYILRLDTHSTELPENTAPTTPVFLTTNEAKNSPMNTEGKILVKAGKFLLIDLR